MTKTRMTKTRMTTKISVPFDRAAGLALEIGRRGWSSSTGGKRR